jgi:hypothetical protein
MLSTAQNEGLVGLYGHRYVKEFWEWGHDRRKEPVELWSVTDQFQIIRRMEDPVDMSRPHRWRNYDRVKYIVQYLDEDGQPTNVGCYSERELLREFSFRLYATAELMRKAYAFLSEKYELELEKVQEIDAAAEKVTYPPPSAADAANAPI